MIIYLRKWGVQMKEILKDKLKFCRLSGIIENYDNIFKEAQENDWNNETFFENLIEYEVIVRENNRFERLLRQAKFSNLKTIDQFEFSAAPYLSKTEILNLFDCQFIEDNTNLLFLGAPGTGKSHISVSIGVEACKQGKSVGFFTAANLGNQLVEMQEEQLLNKFLKS